MWYPPQQMQQQSWHEYVPYRSAQQQNYLNNSKASYYCNGDELSNVCFMTTNNENESSIQCQASYNVTTSDRYVTTTPISYGDEMASYHRTLARQTYWNPAIVAPAKTSLMKKDVNTSAVMPSSVSSACWDWVLFTPEYYSELYAPSISHVNYHQRKFDDEEENDSYQTGILTCLPTCLFSLFYLTPKLISALNDENDTVFKMNSSHITDEILSSPFSRDNIENKIINISSNLSLISDKNKSVSNLNFDGDKCEQNRSPTPDTDDGYQSASDASRSDYSQQSLTAYDHHNSKDDIRMKEHSLPMPLMAERVSYAAVVKPMSTLTNKVSSLTTSISKPKQMINNLLSTTGVNDVLNISNQKSKFIAPRFERMHHARQYNSSLTSAKITIKNSQSVTSNRTQIRSNNNNNNNNNQKNYIVNSTRRR